MSSGTLFLLLLIGLPLAMMFMHRGGRAGGMGGCCGGHSHGDTKAEKSPSDTRDDGDSGSAPDAAKPPVG